MTIFRTLMVAVIACFALALTTGCGQKGTPEKAGPSVSKRAEDAAKIVQDAQKRVQDSLKVIRQQQKSK
jgi:hypothetical protein